MVMTELGACEWFVWDLRRSNLIDRGQLDQIVGDFLQQHPRAEPSELAEYLVSQEILSQFQAERLLQGKTQGFVLGPFTLMDALGVGSMGTVYKAVSKTDNQDYAVKVLPRRSMWNVRIARRKVRAFESCRHPSVVPFVDVGTSGGMHYLAWPYVEGTSLDQLVKERGKLSLHETIEFAFHMAEGLEACHQQKLFHGLFKPSNIKISPEGELFILDFGIGCLLAETEGESLVDTMSTANSVASGLDCSSPESIMDPTNLNPIGDQYSLGCVIYFCLTGQFPFAESSAAELMMAHQFKEPVPLQELNPEVPAELAAIVERLMQKSPQDRFDSTTDVVEALRPLIGEATQRSRAAQPSHWTSHISSPSTETPPMGGTCRASIPTMSDMPALATPAAAAPTKPPPQAVPNAAAMKTPSKFPLPSRQSMRNGDEAEPVVTPVPPPAYTPGEDRVIPGGFNSYGSRSWEEKLGTLGIAVGAIVAAVLAWLVASRFF